ncbi:MAG TPA: hypothetical protein VFF48_01650 [Brevundimonas sp.]|nr:hypothetical protein [Brevundimonas sp.]
MTTSTHISERLRRVVVAVKACAETETVGQTVLRLLKARPELGGWDWVLDIRNPHEKASLEELEEIASAFNERTSTMAYTVFVSSDPGTYDRCALLGARFQRRCHLVARDMAEVERLLPQAMSFI